ncbi:zinc-binding alcohol dehydrogenase family protein [Actinomyces haliotis]|uniref:zinc-binding alcohol dehydrogenase family protein n=1 Tax=Actinomyces haliotis TaxID=1280843 RepID=UPI00189039EF|nr:zinc-binding alcohol dehydrogenase family protein [Actinomyces haliotis]
MTRTTTAIGYTDNLPASDPASLVEREVELPEPGPHDLVVAVEAVSVNPIDTKARRAQPSGGFRVLGFDAAGTVAAVGSEVTLFGVGDEVAYAGQVNRDGSNARLQLVDERIVGRRPSGLSWEEAASLPLTTLTAWESVMDRLGLTEASEGTLLVIGATGGVGVVLLQLAEALLPGVRVIATASDDERAALVRELGAEEVVDHHGDLAEQVEALAPDGVDWVFTSHSEDMAETLARIVKPFGEVVAIDVAPGNLEALKSKAITWHWESMFTRAVFGTPDVAEQHAILERLADLVEEGRVRPVIQERVSPISAATLRAAHERIESGRTLGKIVLSGWE